MQGHVLKGQLTYVDTEEGRIEIMDTAEGKVIALNIDADTEPLYVWERLLGSDVEAVVVDGKTKDVYLVAEE